MPQVFEIFVERSRSAQPKEYESSAAKCALKAQVADGEDWEKAATDLMAKARGVVYETIGIRTPAKKGQETTTPPAPAKTEEKSEAKTESKEETPAKPKKRGPGRPTKAEVKAREEAEKKAAEEAAQKEAEAAGTDGDNGDDIPDDTPAPNKEEAEAAGKRADAEAKRQASEASKRQKAAKDDDDIPDDGDDAAPSEEEMSYTEVQQTISKMVNDRVIGVDQVKALIKEYDVARVADLPADKRQEFLDKLKASAKGETAEA